MKPETSKYSPLPIDEDESTPLGADGRVALEDLDIEGARTSRSGPCGCTGRKDSTEKRSPSSRLLFWACTLSLLCSFINLVVLALPSSWRVYPLTHLSGTTDSTGVHPLERPSVYNGLAGLPPNVSRAALPASLTVYPPFFQPVDHVHRFRVFPDDEHARFTFNGKVSPGDKHVLLAEHVTMIAQFRVHDFGMERCRLTSTIPAPELLAERNQTLHIAGDTSVVEVWNLTLSETDTARTTTSVKLGAGALDPRTLTWDNKPPRERIMARFAVEAGTTRQSEEFWCGPSGSLQTIELLCRGPGCYVEFWQDIYFKPRFGIYISQSPSL